MLFADVPLWQQFSQHAGEICNETPAAIELSSSSSFAVFLLLLPNFCDN